MGARIGTIDSKRRKRRRITIFFHHMVQSRKKITKKKTRLEYVKQISADLRVIVNIVKSEQMLYMFGFENRRAQSKQCAFIYLIKGQLKLNLILVWFDGVDC